MVFRTLVTKFAEKRIPLIKFRSGSNAEVAGAAKTHTPQQASSPSPQDRYVEPTVQYSTNAIEDWELPHRFARKPISADEMEYINRGGPA